MAKGSNRRYKSGRGRERHLSVRSVRRASPDLGKYSRALIALALEEAAAEAAAEAQGPALTAEATTDELPTADSEVPDD